MVHGPDWNRNARIRRPHHTFGGATWTPRLPTAVLGPPTTVESCVDTHPAPPNRATVLLRWMVVCPGTAAHRHRLLDRIGPIWHGTCGRGLSSLDGIVEHDQTGTSIRTALAAAQALNVSMDYLVGFVNDPTPTRELVLNLRAHAALLVDLGITQKADEEHLNVDSDDFVGVNEIVASAGTGAEVINERITDRVKFRRPWMRRHGMQRTCAES